MDIEAGLKRPKIDMHCHSWRFEKEEDEGVSTDCLVEVGTELGITEFWCSSPVLGERVWEIGDVQGENNAVHRAMKRHPNHIRGMCHVQPSHHLAALDELERCLDLGMIGLKLYHQYKLSDPVHWPVIERAIDHKIPILMHAGWLAPEPLAGQPNVSHGGHFAVTSQRYPEAMLIHAHIGGGGDWERSLREMHEAGPNVYVDVSGSNLDDGQVEFTVEQMGIDRVLFGTDGTMTGCVGKVLDAKLGEDEKEMIFWGNSERVLAAQGAKPLTARNNEVSR